MIRTLKWFYGAALLVVVIPVQAFSLLGPFKTGGNGGEAWQTAGFDGRPRGLGYSLVADIGGPMFAHEAYRWTVPTITYAFDASFIRYFGSNGIAAVEEAIGILNALPPASRMSETLDEYPLDTKGQNGDAAAIGLLDVKSTALAVLVEELGLTNPERFVFGLRRRDVRNNFTNYVVIQMNYDPVTIQQSRYVNGVLYNYVIEDALGRMGDEWASAVEWYQNDPLRLPYSSVAGSRNPDATLGDSPDLTTFGAQGLFTGQYFSGLTRDDVGGLRFLLSTQNMVFESLLPTVVPSSVVSSTKSPWGPIFGTNIFGGTNTLINLLGTNIVSGFVTTALRPGVDKLTFQRVSFDSIVGATFTPITNRYTDTYINTTNGRIVKQSVARGILVPDIVFAVDDLGSILGAPIIWTRTTTAGWFNNAALNTAVSGSLEGPGVIAPGIVITYSDILPYTFNVPGGTDLEGGRPTAWGSFDGTDRPPVVYPVNRPGLLDELRSLATQRK